MTTTDQMLADFLRTRVAGVRLEDARVIDRILNEMDEALGASTARTSRWLVRAAAEEGVAPLIRELASDPHVAARLDAVAAALATKRHLDPKAAESAVRVWAVALDVAEFPASPQSDAPSVSLPSTRSSHGARPMSHAWRIALVIGIAVIASIGGYLYRDLVVEGLRCIALVIALLPFIWLMYELCLALFRFWPVRKLWEGAGLIARALDRIPGVVYVIVLALGVCDVFQWLPFGLRDIAAWLPQRERRVETPSDFERPTPKMKDGLFVASPTTLAPMPSEGHTAPSIPTPEIPPLSTKPRTASGKEGGTPQVLEFHVPGYGNATEHVTVRGPFQAGDVVPATWRGQPIWLRVKRPLPDSLYGQGVSRWLAVPVDLQGEPIVAAP